MRIIPILIIAAITSTAHAQPRPLSKRPYPIDTTLTLEQLISELRDDDIRSNAEQAMRAILRYPTSPVERLYEALDDPEWQTRQIACHLLWSIRTLHERLASTNNDMVDTTSRYARSQRDLPAWRQSEYPPVTKRLVEVTIEGLRDDQTPYERVDRRALMYTNAAHGLFRLIPIAHDWIPQLREALHSDDNQQRLFAAMIAGRAGIASLVEPAAAELLPHLRDNDIREDAKFAVWALGGFDRELLPILQRAIPTADPQQRDLMQLLMLDMIDPPTTLAEREERGRRYNNISRSVHDPVTEPPREFCWWWVDEATAE